MSALFIRDKNKIAVNPVVLYIPEFKAVWDKYEDKGMFDREMAYIFFVADYRSDYVSYGNERPIVVAKDVMPKGWHPDNITNEAVDKYKELQKTTSMRFLEWSRMSIASITDYFRDITVMPNDSPAEKKRKMDEFDPGKVVKLLKDVEPILTKLDNIETKVMKEESLGENKIRGGGDVGFFEDPESMNFLKS